jgi:hypothetical protein
MIKFLVGNKADFNKREITVEEDREKTNSNNVDFL